MTCQRICPIDVEYDTKPPFGSKTVNHSLNPFLQRCHQLALTLVGPLLRIVGTQLELLLHGSQLIRFLLPGCR